MAESTLLLTSHPRTDAATEVRNDRGHSRLPLWLTHAEAEALLALSITSPLDRGYLEEELFPRVSAFVQQFEQPGPSRANA